MEEHCGIDPNLPEVEIVYELLKASQNQSRKLRDLLQQAFIIKGLPLDDHQKMAAVHTEIIMDHRFTSMGQGHWGLKEWNQEKIVRRTVSHAGAHAYPFRRRSLLEEIVDEEKNSSDKNEDLNYVAEEEWDE